jgi:hypothetical protein
MLNAKNSAAEATQIYDNGSVFCPSQGISTCRAHPSSAIDLAQWTPKARRKAHEHKVQSITQVDDGSGGVELRRYLWNSGEDSSRRDGSQETTYGQHARDDDFLVVREAFILRRVGLHMVTDSAVKLVVRNMAVLPRQLRDVGPCPSFLNINLSLYYWEMRSLHVDLVGRILVMHVHLYNKYKEVTNMRIPQYCKRRVPSSTSLLHKAYRSQRKCWRNGRPSRTNEGLDFEGYLLDAPTSSSCRAPSPPPFVLVKYVLKNF